MPLHFVTGNKGKFSEIKSLIPDLQQLDIDLDEIQEIDPHKVIAHKLLQAKQHLNEELIIEDTSLYITGLHGLPGSLIKWFLQSLGTSGLATLCQKTENTAAVAKTIIGYLSKDGEPIYFEGSVEGKIVPPKGEFGFGWDSIFLPSGSEKTFAELTPEEKANFSMRKIATLQLRDHLAYNRALWRTRL